MLLSTRTASIDIGGTATGLCPITGAPTTVLRLNIRKIGACVGAVKLCGDGTRGVVGAYHVLLRRRGNRIPRSHTTLRTLPNMNHGATGIMLGATFN